MNKVFTPSINIIRDAERELDYLVTENAERAYSVISENVASGNRAFSLLGTYGTGKSAFLLALERQLRGEAKYFKKPFSVPEETSFIKIVGAYESCEYALARKLGANGRATEKGVVFEQLEKLPKDQLHVILIDEFGKFLEHAGQHAPEEEMYFLQQLAEYVSDPDQNIVLITTLHQSFDAYAAGLEQKQRNEWEKVKGRLTEVTFNEPVEQLLYIASERINHKGVKSKKDSEVISLLSNEKNIVSLNTKGNTQLASKLFPLDLVSATVLAQALQRYGQNERSLFTFLETETQEGLKSFLDKKGSSFYHLGKVFDYLLFNFYSSLSSTHNPDYFKWGVIKEALSRAETQFDSNQHEDAFFLIKVIGLLGVFSKGGAQIDRRFLEQYAKTAMGSANAPFVISSLEAAKIIRYQEFRQCFILFEGSDFDIEQAFRKASQLVEPSKGLVSRLLGYFKLSYLPARSYFYKTGTPRFFKFILSEEPVTELDRNDGEIDGYINLYFSSNKEALSEKPQILYGKYESKEIFSQLIREVDIADEVLKQIVDDPVAKREVNLIKANAIERLNQAIIAPVLEDPDLITWSYNGQEVEHLQSTTVLNQFLSHICEAAFPSTPIYKNELANRTKLSPAISTARKKLLKALEEHWQEKDLGFKETTFPAEKTIYQTLIANNLHELRPSGLHGFRETPQAKSFGRLWESGTLFLQSARENSRKISELVDIWLAPPFGLKRGFIDIWLPVYLFIKKNDYTLFDKEQRLIPYITADTLDLVLRKPQDYYLKGFEIDGKRLDVFNKYRELTQLDAEGRISAEGFLDTIRPFLAFYKQLPAYTQQTKNLPDSTIAFRNVLVNSKDPERLFFEELPASLGVTYKELIENEEALALFSIRIQECIRDLREALANLAKRIEREVLLRRGIDQSLPYEEYKSLLLAQFSDVNTALLRPNINTFFLRLKAPFDDAQAWIGSICQAVYKKGLDSLKDQDIEFVIQKIVDSLRELDNVRTFTDFDTIREDEEVIRFEITSLRKGRDQKTFTNTSKTSAAELAKVKKTLKAKLSKDKDLNITALAEMLQEILDTDD